MPSGLLYLSAMPVLSILLALRLSCPSRGWRQGARAAVGTILVTEAGRAGGSAQTSAAWKFGRLG